MRTIGKFTRRAAPRGSRRRRSIFGATAAVMVAVAAVIVTSAGAVANPPCTTPNTNTLDATGVGGGTSTFEIDAPMSTTVRNKTVTTKGANLVLDGLAANCTDWLTTATGAGTGVSADRTAGVIVKADKDSGSADDAFGQGTSENDANPTIVSGSIPPNKSDLQDFGIYRESNSTGKFLDLFWSRVNAPTGTTDMAFELNKNVCDPSQTPTNCATNGVTPVRSDGDKLVNYKLSSGGTQPIIEIFTWSTGSGWTNATTISGGAGEALGSVNFDTIDSKDSGGLGQKDPLTFGEASISFKALFTGASCGSFGSVYLKSQASDGLTDEEKDFIAPQSVLITNCTTLSTSASNQSSAQTIGGSITDTATLSGATSPTGSVTFNAYGPFDASTPASSDTCTDGDGGNNVFTSTNTTFTGPNGTGDYTVTSDAFATTSVGRYEWVASYSGDGNNAASSTSCGDAHEASLVAKANSTISTSQSWIPNDSATIDHGGGSVVFSLFKNDSTCTNTSKRVYGPTSSLTVPSTSPYTVATANTTYTVTSVTSGDTYYWKAAYTSGDASHKDVTSCAEATAFSSIANGSAVTSS